MDGIENKFELEGGDNKWYGQDIKAESDPIIDPGTGKSVVLRVFEFGVNPKTARELREKKIKLSKQDLFNAHWPQIRALIWGDGMVANQDVDPRVIVGRKSYRIFVLCEPRMGVMVNDKHRNAKDILK